MNPQYPCKICQIPYVMSKIKILQYAVTYATCGATLNMLTYLLKSMKKLQKDDISAWYCLICASRAEVKVCQT